MEEEKEGEIKNRIRFGKEGTFSGMNLDSMTMRMEDARPGGITKGRRWRAINAGQEPFSGTSNSYQGQESQGDEKKWGDVIEHPERYIKGEK